MGTLLQDLRYALRILWKRPAFALVTILTLALGIGFNTAIFSMVNAVLLRQLPFARPNELVWVWSTRVDRDKAFFSIPNFLDYRERNRTLGEMAAWINWGANLTGGGEPERLQGLRMTVNSFEMLGVQAGLGRTLLSDDARSTNQRVAVLSYGLWQRRFGGDAGLIGKTLTLNGESYTVVGVLPRDFIFPNAPDAEIAVPFLPERDARRTERGSNFLRAFARLKPGVTAQQAQADLAAITNELQKQYPDDNAKLTAPRVVPLSDEIVGNYRRALMLLLGAVGLVLLIACSNLANLLLARASARHKEITVRAALGATRRRLIRQLLTESLLLALLGGGLGLFLATWGVDLLLALSPSDLPRSREITIDARVLGFTLLLSLLSGIFSGLVPAFQSSKVNLSEELKGESRGLVGGTKRNRARSALVVTEVALSLLLLVGAGLLVKSFARLEQVSPGFDAHNLLLVRFSLPQTNYTTRESIANFYAKLAPRVLALPGVEGAGVASVLPLSGANARADFIITSRPPLRPSDAPAAQNRWISPGYLQTMKIPLLRGRDITDADNAHAPGVVLVDEALAARYFAPGENPVGFHLKIDDGGREPARDVEIIGVVGNVKHVSLDDEPTPTVYAPIEQVPENTVSFLAGNMSLVVRTSTEPLALARSVRAEMQAVDRDVPASSTRTMEQFISASVAARKFSLTLLALFAVAALLLAAMGIYAVIAYTVTQRTHEIGVRMALGAKPADILRMVIGHGMGLALAGIAIGLAAALVLTRLMSSLLFNVSARDPLTFASIPLLLAMVSLLACYIPARRAMRVDPMVALRYE